MATITISPDDRALDTYYQTLIDLREGQDVHHEQAVRRAFSALLESTARKRSWTLVEELGRPSTRTSRTVYPDATLRDSWQLPHGYWEAKDSADDLDTEIRKKRERGYPFDNIIFEDTQQAILFQDNQEVARAALRDRDQLADLLTRFYNHEIEPFTEFDQAVTYFQNEIPHIANGLKERIEEAYQDDRAFRDAFAGFMELCQTALNPQISREAVNEMLIQHMLTERIIRKVFDNEQFTRRNVIAAEVEKVIDSLTGKYFNRAAFLGALDRFYNVIETAAEKLATFSDKQHFINTVYERFFQGYSVKVADTHGIVYTPQEIVDFMCAAVEEVLEKEFGAKLGGEGVTILDPCTGTGNFIVNLLYRAHERNPRDFERFYREQLFANEVMLMPYYIASLNIEHAYYELTEHYESFEGICFVDTLDLAEGPQMKLAFMTEKNTARVERQKKTPITVIIGNPPYNVGQLNENDNNKNRTYQIIDSRVSDTYAKDSQMTLKTKLYDPYVKFFRWATDRLGNRDGIVCLVTNNSFVEQNSFDGMRKHLLEDFTRIFHLDLHGNVRENPKLSGTTHNVFGIQVGVGITVAIRSSQHKDHKVFYRRVAEDWRKEEKLAYLLENVDLDGKHNSLNTILWQELIPDKNHTWLVPKYAQEFESFLALGTKEAKSSKGQNTATIFKTYSLGISTNRDSTVYDFNLHDLAGRIEKFSEDYNAEVDRYIRAGRPSNVDDFVRYAKIKWSYMLKSKLNYGRYSEFNVSNIRKCLYRPFSKKHLYLEDVLVDAPGLQPYFHPEFPNSDNLMIVVSDIGYRASSPSYLIADGPVDLHLLATTDGHQCFPFYVYDADGGNRRENITDWALAQFREHYNNPNIDKWAIFYYVYGLLHHPEYRERYADNLKRELPRIPFAPDFAAFSEAGRQLAELHLNYESVKPYRLEWEHDGPIDFRVEKMRPGKKTDSPDGPYNIFASLKVNDTLTLNGIPAQAFDYRLGNRSALEWVIDQYQVKTDKRSGIVSDPNGYSDDERYIVDLVEKVVQVSVETVDIVNQIARLPMKPD